MECEDDTTAKDEHEQNKYCWWRVAESHLAWSEADALVDERIWYYRLRHLQALQFRQSCRPLMYADEVR